MRFHAPIDAVVELGAGWIQAEFDNVITLQTNSAARLHRRKRLPGENTDLHGANQLLGVARLDAGRRHRVKARQQAMQKLPAAAFHHGSQPLAQSLGTNRPLKKPQQQCAQVKPRSAREDGKLGASAQVSQDFQRFAAVISRVENVGGFQAVQQMVRNARRSAAGNFPEPTSKPRYNCTES